MPELFHLYFLLDFNLKKHIIYNNTNIRQYAIKQHIKMASDDSKYALIENMFEFFKNDVDIVINNYIEKIEYVNIFTPYVYLYIFLY